MPVPERKTAGPHRTRRLFSTLLTQTERAAVILSESARNARGAKDLVWGALISEIRQPHLHHIRQRLQLVQHAVRQRLIHIDRRERVPGRSGRLR